MGDEINILTITTTILENLMLEVKFLMLRKMSDAV